MTDADFPLPPVGLLRRYLAATGWTSSKLRIPELALFTLREPNSDALELVVPQNMNVPDAVLRVRAAIDTLASLEERQPADITASVSSIGQDTLREAVAENLYRSVALPVAERVIAGSRRLLHATAIAEYTRIGSDSLQSAATKFVDKCRFGHTFHGSFGFTIHSPIGPKPPNLDADNDPPVPPERLIIQRLIRGMTAFDQERDSYDLEAISDPAIGFSSEMLDGFADLLEGTRSHQVTFAFELSPEWVADEDIPQRSIIPIASSISPMMRDLAADLRRRDIPDASVITGLVTKLATKENPADLENVRGTREVTIGWEWAGKAIAVRVPLSPADYRVAYEAHGSYRRLSAEGKLERAGKGYILRSARLVL